MAAWRVTYTPGNWLVMSGPTMLVVMLPAPARMSGLVNSLWQDVVGVRSVAGLLELLASYGLDGMPDVAAFFWDSSGLHGMARGRIKVVDTETGEVAVDGSEVVTWREEPLGSARHLRIDMEPVDQDAVLQLPLVVGAVSASAVYLTTASDDLVRFPAYEQLGVLSKVPVLGLRPRAAKGATSPASADAVDGGSPEPTSAAAVGAAAAAGAAVVGGAAVAAPVVAVSPELAADGDASAAHPEPEPEATHAEAVEPIEQPAPVVEVPPADDAAIAAPAEPESDAAPEPAPSASEPEWAPEPEPSMDEPDAAPAPEPAPSAAEPEPVPSAPEPAPAPVAEPEPAPEPEPVVPQRAAEDLPLHPTSADADAIGTGELAFDPGAISAPVAPPVAPQPTPPVAPQPTPPVAAPPADRSAPVVVPGNFSEPEEDGGTIFSTGLAATHKPATQHEAQRDPQVLAVPCARGHANAPGSRHCRICSAPVDASNPRLIRRPPLAGVHSNQGEFADLHVAVLVGRSPDVGKAPAGAHLMRVPSPSSDISRSHVLIAPRDWSVIVTDLHSTNGTTVLPVGEQPFVLANGDSVQVELGTVLDLGDGVSLRIEPPRS